MSAATIVWFVLLVAAVVLFVLTVRRMSQLTARTRRLEAFQRSVDSLDRRLAAVVLPLVRTLDETRRHAADPVALGRQVAEAQGIIDTLASEARALVAPAPLAGVMTALTSELDRAARATGLLEHGLAAMGTTSIGRDLEAQTAVKRGTLNLRHAQEAFALRARDVAAARPADLAAAGPGGKPRAPVSTTFVPGGGDDGEEPFDPRM